MRHVPNMQKDVGPDDKPDVRRLFMVMFCKQSNKKRKSWEDGIVVLKNKALTLYSTDGKVLSSRKCRKGEEAGFKVGGSMGFYGKEVEIMEERPYDLFERGTVFINTGTSPTPAAPVKTQSSAINNSFRSVKPKVSHPSSCKSKTTRAATSSGLVLMEPNAKHGTVATILDSFLASKLRPHQVDGIKFLFNCVTGYGADFVSENIKISLCDQLYSIGKPTSNVEETQAWRAQTGYAK